jgi:Na+/glutamate symporter
VKSAGVEYVSEADKRRRVIAMSGFIEWFFNGLGTAALGLVAGSVGGGLIGYRIGKRKSRFKQSQKAGKGSLQYQNGNVSFKNEDDLQNSDTRSAFRQSQVAGDNSKQVQVGRNDCV